MRAAIAQVDCAPTNLVQVRRSIDEAAIRSA